MAQQQLAYCTVMSWQGALLMQRIQVRIEQVPESRIGVCCTESSPPKLLLSYNQRTIYLGLHRSSLTFRRKTRPSERQVTSFSACLSRLSTQQRSWSFAGLPTALPPSPFLSHDSGRPRLVVEAQLVRLNDHEFAKTKRLTLSLSLQCP